MLTESDSRPGAASVVGLAGVLFLLLGRLMRSKRLQALGSAHGESAAAGS